MNTIWSRVDEIIDSSPGVADLRAHGLHLLAARRWRSLGRPISPELEQEEIQAAFLTHAVPIVLAEVRGACEGPIAVMKGPVIAARFPAPSRRPFVDLDLLVGDPRGASRTLVDAGFTPGGDPATYANLPHHLRPLRSPSRPLHVELHSHPKWIEGLEVPSAYSLLEEAEPADLGVHDILMLAPSHHVLVLVAHAWAHDPLTRLLRILDVAVMAEGLDRREVDSLARTWNMGRVWQTTSMVSDALFRDGRQPWILRVPGRGLRTARESTVLELHVGRLITPFYVYDPVRSVRAVISASTGFLRRQEGESWRKKLTRTARQLTHPSMRRSKHVRSIGETAQQSTSSGIADPPEGV
jgi:Uncharacterised nucleotidyltransferase